MSGWSAEMSRRPDFVPSTIFVVEIHALCTFANWTVLTRTCVDLVKQIGERSSISPGLLEAERMTPVSENGDTFVDLRNTNSQNSLRTHFVNVVLFQLTETSVVCGLSVDQTATKTMFELHIVK